MIARIWRGETRADRAEAYTAYLEKTGAKECRETPGNRGVRVLRRLAGDRAQFVFISFWDNWDSIRAFAGSDVEAAHYYPEDKDFLLYLEGGEAVEFGEAERLLRDPRDPRTRDFVQHAD